MAVPSTTDQNHRDLASGKGDGLKHTYLVEAGAGTGKTTVLVDRLLAIVRAGADIARVVAITFTEKAAGELRVRLRNELEDAARGAEGAERGILDRALHDIDRAQVGTIHGFCSGLLRERPVEAGVDPNFAVADDLKRRLLLDAAWGDWLRDEFGRHLPDAVAQARALGFSLARIRTLAESLVEHRDVLDLTPEYTEPGDTGRLTLDLERAASEFSTIAKEHCLDPSDNAAGDIAEFARAVRAIAALPDEMRAVYAITRVKPAPGKQRGRKGNWDDGVLDDLRTRAAALRGRQKELKAAASHNAAVELLRWLEGFVAAYAKEKSRQGVLDFEDLLTKSRNLLRDHGEVREHFKRAYDRILVDEFQDTDPLQCEIVFYLAEEKGRRERDWTAVRLDPGKLFIVGDPKQSIYRFRRADIEMYEEAKAVVRSQGRVLRLVENFRTRPAIVDPVNSVFSVIMHAPEEDRKYQPDYDPLVAHRGADEAGPGIVVLPPAEPFGDGAKAADVRAAEAAAVAAFVARALETGEPSVFDRDAKAWRPVRLRDIAVLFHRTTGLAEYEDAFASRGLDYRIAGGKRFYVRREVTELRTVLSAIEDPHNLVAVVGALRTPFFGVPDDAIVEQARRAGGLSYLATEAGAPEVDQAFELLRELHFERNARGIRPLIEELFDRTGALEVFLLKPDGEQRHANLLKVVELASALEKTEPMSFGGFVRWLREVSQLTPEEAESPLSEEGDEFVRMLTIHKSKGLEFPVTVLADLGRFRDRGGENIVIDREDGRLEFGIGRKGDRFATRGYEGLRELEGRRREAELLRLLYVGLTRARDALVIPWFCKDGGAEGSGLLKHLGGLAEGADDRIRELGGALSPVVRFDTATLDLTRKPTGPVRLRIDGAVGIDPATTPAYAERRRWREWLSGFSAAHDRPPTLLAPSSLALGAEGEPVREGDVAPDAGARGRQFGTLVHAVMERADLEAPDTVLSVARAIARTTGLGSDLVEEAAALVERALDAPIIRRAVAAPRLAREVPFCISHEGAVLEGKIDLLFEEDDGTVIVDYKTDAVSTAGADGLADRYRRQAEAYALAVRQASGRPIKEIVLFFMRSMDEVRLPTREELSLGEALAAIVPSDTNPQR